MLIIPVIDIKDGKCVRVIEGHFDTSRYYCESPVTLARLFRKENFKTLHITDLDGALDGEMKNYSIVKEISDSIDIPIQYGGGVRDLTTARKIIEDLGVYRLVIGTGALTNPDLLTELLNLYGPAKLVVCIDEKLNNVVKNGWIDYADITPLSFAKKMDEIGIQRIIYQDVTRVGNFSGPHLSRLIEIGEQTNLKITSAGGVGSYKDLKTLMGLLKYGVDSAMVSRALYENKFPCQQMWRDIETEDISLDLPSVGN